MQMPATTAPPLTQGAWAGQPPASLEQLDLRRAFAQYRRDFTRYLPADREAVILDFGCGWGGLLAYLARSGYVNCSGADVDPRCVEFCKQHVTRSVVHAPDARGFLAERPATYEAILMRHVIYYLPSEDLTAFLRAAYGALKPGGKLIVQVFNGALFTGAYPRFNDHHIRAVFTEHSLRWALEGAGFRVRTVFGAGGVGRTPKYRVWQTGHRLWSIALRAMYVLERGTDPLNPTIFDRDLVAIAETA
jgi:2-polyprenyl-3-methyl-5-hydroxy-6-metoxy-1,4-benzoquinol methylase